MKRTGKIGICIFSVLVLLMSSTTRAQQDEDTMAVDLPSDTLFSDPDSYGYEENGPVYFNEAASEERVATRTIDPEEVKKIKADEAYWYADLAPKREKPKEEKKSSGNWVNTLFWILTALAFAGLLVWFLASSNIRLFRSSSKRISDTGEEEVLSENIFELRFDEEIRKAIAAKNYRLAVRLYYLQLLRELSERGLINYTPEKTNSDYVFQLSGTPHYRDFFRLTRSFEYVWYGKFVPAPPVFESMQNDFLAFKQKLGA